MLIRILHKRIDGVPIYSEVWAVANDNDSKVELSLGYLGYLEITTMPKERKEDEDGRSVRGTFYRH